MGSAIMLAAALIIVGCGEDGGTNPDPQDPADPPTYTTDIEPILRANCSCHQPGGSLYGSTPLDTYANVFERRELVKEYAGVTGTMPPAGPLPQEQRDLIIEWVDEGAPE